TGCSPRGRCPRRARSDTAPIASSTSRAGGLRRAGAARGCCPSRPFDAAETTGFRRHPSSMHNITRPQTVASWALQLAVAGILLQTLFFKFTGAEESVFIFSSVGRFIGIAAVEPWGRIGSGVIELVASLLLLVPATASLGAILTIGVMAGAIASHLFILGID